jgi:hypothetical protein
LKDSAKGGIVCPVNAYQLKELLIGGQRGVWPRQMADPGGDYPLGFGCCHYIGGSCHLSQPFRHAFPDDYQKNNLIA